MTTNGRKSKLATIGAVALLAVAIVPMLAASAGASTLGPSAASTSARSGEWAYGGEGWNSGGLQIGASTLTWNSSAGVDVIYNATNTSANTTELTATRTVVVSVTATYTGPAASWAYSFKAVEDDLAYANLTNASSVTLANSSVVSAIGLLNASLLANASVRASLVGTSGNQSVGDYLNVTGWAKAHVAFSPSLGLVPLNLTGVSSWSSQATASGNAAWNVSWSYVNHGWNGTKASHQGDFNGTWSTTTLVTLYGRIAGNYSGWSDHRLRTAVGLSVDGPFDLYAGVLLVPHGFDVFHGAAANYAGAGMGAGTVTNENLYLSTGRVTARSFTAESLATGASTPVAYTTGSAGASPAVTGAANAPPSGETVWAQPESPSAAASQANCLQYGCSGGSGPLGKLLVPLVVVGLAAVVAVAVVVGLRSRGRGGRKADIPLAPANVYAPAPPTGTGPAGPGNPPQ